jgi:hypothetical protein
MTYDEFVNDIQASYKGEYNAPDLKEIKQFFIQNQINEIGIQNLYNAIKINYLTHQLPTFAHIVKFYNEKSQFKSTGNTGDLHPESPLQQLHRAKDWSVDKILKNCQNIRKKQDQTELASREISFLAIWEKLKEIQPDVQKIAKDRIVNNGDRELLKPANLDDLQIEYEPIKINSERKEKINSIKSIINEIPL